MELVREGQPANPLLLLDKLPFPISEFSTDEKPDPRQMTAILQGTCVSVRPLKK